MKTRRFFPGLIFLHVGLGDDTLGDAVGSAVWSAGEASLNAAGAIPNGLLQLPSASFQAGQAAGNAAVDFFNGAGGITAADGAVTPTADGSVGDAIQSTTDSPICDAKSLRQSPGAAPGTACPADPVVVPNPKDDSNKNPDIEIDVFGDPVSPKSTSHDDCDSENSQASLRALKQKLGESTIVATARIVWPSDAGNSVQNENIQNALTERTKNPEDVVVSDDDGRTFFWSVPLTDKTVEDLKAAMIGIEFIASDGHVTMSGSSTAAKLAQKRAANVVIQQDAPPHLEYISRPPDSSDSLQGFISHDAPSLGNPPSLQYRYTYLENAGQNINGYVLDVYGPSFSFDPEFSTHKILKKTLQALQPAGFVWDGRSDFGHPGHAARMVSLMAGFRFGVAKKASLVLVQQVLLFSSVLDAFRQVRADLRKSGQQTRGYTVIYSGFSGPMNLAPDIEAKIKQIMLELMNDYQAVIVVAAGNSKKPYRYLQINEWPSIWASDDFPIVVVGGVDMESGKTSPGSRTGPSMTVSAPFWTVGSLGPFREGYGCGTCDSASIVAGVIMGYLSDEDVRSQLNLAENENPNPSTSVASKIRAYVVEMAYARPPGGVRVVWNGMS